MTITIRDSDGTTRLIGGDLLAPGGATGDVLTQQADGTYTPAAGGGATPVTETYSGPTATVAADTPTSLAWAAGAGTAGLLDLSVPAAPTVVDAGTYTLALTVLQMTNAATPAIWRANLTVATTVTGSANTTAGATASASFDDTDFLSAAVALSLTFVAPAGGAVLVQVLQEDSGAVGLAISESLLVKIG